VVEKHNIIILPLLKKSKVLKKNLKDQALTRMGQGLIFTECQGENLKSRFININSIIKKE
jgi:hypothetical protein